MLLLLSMSLAELVPVLSDDASFEREPTSPSQGEPIGIDGVTDLLLCYEELFAAVPDAFELFDFDEETDGVAMYAYRAVFSYEHLGDEYQIQIRRISISQDRAAAGGYFGYIVEIFSPVEVIDEHHSQYDCQRVEFSADANDTSSLVTSRTVVERDGVVLPSATEGKLQDAVAAYHQTHEHPDNPVDAEGFHQQMKRDLFGIAWDIIEEDEAFKTALGEAADLPAVVTGAVQSQLQTLARLIHAFGRY